MIHGIDPIPISKSAAGELFMKYDAMWHLILYLITKDAPEINLFVIMAVSLFNGSQV